MDFPSLYTSLGKAVVPSVRFAQKSIKSSIVSEESEAGYAISRPRYTRNKKAFSVTYNAIEYSVYETLNTFFEDSALGRSNFFNWTHPKTAVVYNVRFDNDELNIDTESADKVTVSFNLLEV